MNPKDQISMNHIASNDVASTQRSEGADSTSQRKPCLRKVWRAVAISATVCVLLTGLFFAWMCVDFRPSLQSVSMEEIKGVCFPEKGVEGASYAPGYQFTFSVKETISMQWTIKVNTGGFLDKRNNPATNGYKLEYLGKEFTIDNGQTVYWSLFEYVQTNKAEVKSSIIVEAILCSQSNIVGYCVMEIEITDPAGVYAATILDSAYYPPQNGKYQDIPMGYIRKQILKAKILG